MQGRAGQGCLLPPTPQQWSWFSWPPKLGCPHTLSLHARSSTRCRTLSATTHHSLSYNMGPPGSFPYMAPELLAGLNCTESVDIYSFGEQPRCCEQQCPWAAVVAVVAMPIVSRQLSFALP